MEIFTLSPKENMIEKIANYVIDNYDIDRISDLKLLFPNRRPKYFLIKYLSDILKKPFYPPRIYSMDDFIDELFIKIFPNFRTLNLPEGVFKLYKIFSNEPSHFNYPEYKEIFSNFEEFYPFGVKLLQAFEELYIERISPEQLKQQEAFIEYYSSLSKTYRDFYLMLEKEGFATRAFKYIKVAEFLTPSFLESYTPIHFCGLFGLTKAEQRLTKKIEEFFANGELKGDLIIWHYSQNISPKEEPEFFIYECPDRHGQAIMLGNILKEVQQNEETVIVLPSEDLLFPVIKHALSDLNNENYNLSMGYPLLRTPIWSFLNSLWKIINSLSIAENNVITVYTEDYLEFILHPYVKNIRFKGDPAQTRIIFHSLESYLSEQESLVVALSDLEDNIIERVFQSYDELKNFNLKEIKEHIKNIHENLLLPFIKVLNISQFSKNIANTLRYIYLNSTAPYHPLFFPFYSFFMDKLNELEHSLLSNISLKDASSYFNFLKGYLKNFRIPFEGVPVRGLQILGFLETRNLRFKTVFFLDLNEEVFPPIYEDFILPLRVRQALNLPTFSDREHLIEHYFRNLLFGAENVYLFYVKDGRKERSRFIEKIIWNREKIGNSINTTQVSYRINLSAGKPAEIIKNDSLIEYLKKFKYSPSSLDVYLKCPIKFYYAYVLGLKPKDEPDIDSAKIGDIVHAILANFFKRFEGKEALRVSDLDWQSVKYLAEEEFSKRYGTYISGSIYLIREQIIKRLIETIEWFKEKVKSSNSIKILAAEMPFSVELNGINIGGRIDLVEEIEDRINVVDFKTSGRSDNYRINPAKLIEDLEKYTKRINTNERTYFVHQIEKSLASLQIALYMLAVSKNKDFAIKQIGGYYLLLGRARLDSKVVYEPFEKEKQSDNPLFLIENILNLLIQELLNINIPFYPTKNFKNNCPYCDFKTLCGTLWVKSRD